MTGTLDPIPSQIQKNADSCETKLRDEVEWIMHRAAYNDRPDWSDGAIASAVRMLMRYQIDHEAVVCSAAYRICSLSVKNAELQARLDKLNTPELEDFSAGVVLEAQHQRERWPEGHDHNKSPADWFWTLGYLAQKAMHAHESGDPEKLKHHLITSAALMANWHAIAIDQADHSQGKGKH